MPYRSPLFGLALFLALSSTAQAVSRATAQAAPSPSAPLPRATPAEVGLDADRLDEITRTLEAFVAQERIAGAVVGVARHGRLAYLEAVGLREVESGAPMTTDAIFRMYSMAKAVTAVGAMLLHEEGRFRLSDPVSLYEPRFASVRVLQEDGSTRPPTRPITVEDLFLHTAGLSHRSSREYREAGVRSRGITLFDFVDNVVAVPLREDPGSRFRYSASPTVLGHLIEIWSGQPLDVFLEEHVFAPIGMHDSSFQVRPEGVDRLAAVYATDDDGLRPHAIEEVPFTERPALLEGSVGLVSTVPDFLRFSQMLLNGGELDGVRILPAETVARMTANGLSDETMAGRTSGRGWALANVSVVVDADAAGEPHGSYRWDGSAGTEFVVDPSSGTVLVTAWQSVPANPERLRQRLRALVRDAVRE